ncbi:hypothetical protein TMU01_21080 [Tenuibacillus multivorans]|nr:hypothetical protein TMU01_21080 [Tenuibacillus multivorans]
MYMKGLIAEAFIFSQKINVGMYLKKVYTLANGGALLIEKITSLCTEVMVDFSIITFFLCHKLVLISFI